MGGGGKKQKAPKAPDYAKLAQQEADQSYKIAQDVTKWNRPTQKDAFGNSITWSQDASGNWTQQQNLSPQYKEAQQKGLTGYNQAMDKASANAQQGFKAPEAFKMEAPRDPAATEAALARASAGDFTNTAGEIGNFDRTQGDKVAADMYEAVMGRARPEQAREQSALDVKLRQQGLQPGTEAYNRAMQNMLTAHGDVATQAGLNATQAGYGAARDIYNTNLGGQGQRFQQLADTYGINQAQDWKAFEGQRGLNQDQLNREQLRMAAQNQEYGQALKNYQMPFDVAGSMANLYAAAPRPEFAGFSGATGYNPANLMGAGQAKYESQMGGYNAGQNKKGSSMGMLGSLGSSAITAFSDSNLKEDIQPLGGKESLDKLLELGGYEFKWRSDGTPDLGLMAQQVQKVLPELVASRLGYLAVNYTGIVALLVAAVNYLAQELNHAKHV